jgi:hypothetical protein
MLVDVSAYVPARSHTQVGPVAVVIAVNPAAQVQL